MKIIKRFNNLPQGMKASIAYFAASVIIKGLAYITTPIYTRLLTPEEYGGTTVYMTWSSVLGIIAMFSLQAGVFNNGMADYPEKRNEYSFSMLVLSNIITIFFSVLILLLYPYLKDFMQIDLCLLYLMILTFFFQPAYNFWSTRQRYELKYKYQIIISLFCAIISPLIAILTIIYSNGNHLYARIFGGEIPLILVYISFYLFIFQKKGGKLNTSYWKEALLFNLPLIPHYLSAFLLNSSDKIMISYLIGNRETAFYSVAYSIAASVLMIWFAANSSLIPFTYEKCKEKNFDSISKVVLPILTIFAFACVLLNLLAPEILFCLTTKDYYEALDVIPPIIGGVFFQAMYYAFANIVYYYKKTLYVMFASILATILNFALNFIFINMYGYIAAGYTTLICYLVQAFIDYCAMKYTIKQKVYDINYIILLSIAVILFSLFSKFLYVFTIVRYVFIICMLFGIYIFRNKIIHAFNFSI